jgi:hypothetical protein
MPQERRRSTDRAVAARLRPRFSTRATGVSRADRGSRLLAVGRAAPQGFASSDIHSIAAGIDVTVVPILIFFIAVQRHLVPGLAGAIKG